MINREKKYLVVGLGKTGIETARFLLNRDLDLRAIDSKARGELSPEVGDLIQNGLSVETGPHTSEQFEWADTVIISPGVSFNTPIIKKFRQKGKEIISEIELASSVVKKPLIAITGSNGKTTTCTLLDKVLRDNGYRVFLGGNIGTPMITIADTYDEYDYIILELSSFQLQGTTRFKPFIATILNISQNHLDHHLNFEEYLSSKLKIFENQDEKDWAILNRDDEILRNSATDIKAGKIKLGKDSGSDIYREGKVVYSSDHTYDLTGIKLLGNHNLDNTMTVIAVSEIVGCDPLTTAGSITNFTPLPHRTELLRIINGVSVYNDSKSTTPDSTIRALKSFESPVILIMGGRDKGLDYSVLNDSVKERVKHLILYGEAKDKLKEQICGNVKMTLVNSLEEAARKATEISDSGDSILFSPACSSFDMFSSYVERGKEFKRVVELL